MKRFNYALAMPLLLVACGPSQNDPGPGGVTVGEAQALDDAAEMLDERNRPLVDVSEARDVTPQP
ncbi:MAG: hypothetical protein V7676_10305 [Parasphingorhabdus sp.]|uniref:hypothetical protein n=1 Tax=Parasphingorhabdus sp. TaxID=2709688 RepID=UPI00300163F6